MLVVVVVVLVVFDVSLSFTTSSFPPFSDCVIFDETIVVRLQVMFVVMALVLVLVTFLASEHSTLLTSSVSNQAVPVKEGVCSYCSAMSFVLVC